MTQPNRIRFQPILLGAALAFLTVPWASRSQPAVGGQGFKFAEYYDRPHETQMKSMLEGARGQGLPGGLVQVEEAKYRTWRVTGEGELVAQAPQCSYDPRQKFVSSAGPIHVQTADGRFSIDGVGFLFQQTNSTLLISNSVHTIVHPELLSQPQGIAGVTNAEVPLAAGYEVFSDRFDYGEKTGIGVYLGNVRVVGTNLNSTAGIMTIVLPAPERRLKTLTAETNVVIDYETLHATGERAVYTEETGLIQMTGQPSWRIEQREGSGDELVLDRTNRVFRANGHARMKLPAQSMGESSFLAGHNAGTAHPASTTNHFVEIQCADYEIRTNLAVFRQDVRVEDRVGEQRQGQMTCELMTLTIAGTNELQKMVAERRVVIGQQDNEFTADRAEYTGTNGVLDLTGTPAWRAGSREGSGDLIRVQPAREEMLVKGNAVMKLPASELGQSAITAVGKPKPAGPSARTNEFAVVRSQEYFVTPDSALFKGGVRIEHPQMQWVCQEVTMLSLAQLGKDGRMIIAEPQVVFDAVDDQGRKFHGTGDKAVLTHRVTATLTNDVVVLTGKPAVLQTTNLIGRNNIITLDLANHTLTAPGKYKVWGALPEGAVANMRSPKAAPFR